jgi:GNAT superfamily N-acetyltransferase
VERDGVEIVPVTSRAEQRAFWELPYELYARDPNWVAPLRAMERRRWLPQRNASLRTRRVRRFLAYQHRNVVGRIASVVDPIFAQRWGAETGFFGFFECVDDVRAAGALFASAEDDLRSVGVRHILGPINLTTNDEVGLLVDGFDSPPLILSPYNPPFYPGLLEAAGYGSRTDYHSYAWTPAASEAPVVARLQRVADRNGVTIRCANPKRWTDDSRLLFELYNASFADLWGFVPITWDEFRAQAEDFHSFYRPELVLFAERNGQAIGFGLTLPDINAALARLKGRLWPFGWLRLALGMRRIRHARFILLGVLPQHRARGVAVVIAAAMADAARRAGLAYVELSLIQADNRRIQTVIAACGGTRVKTFRLYQRWLGD